MQTTSFRAYAQASSPLSQRLIRSRVISSVAVAAFVFGALAFDQYLSLEPSSTTVAQASVSNTLSVSTASFLGGSQDDTLEAVEVTPDKTIVYGGKLADNNFGRTPINLSTVKAVPAGAGIILRTDSTGKNVLSVSRIGGSVDDLDINRSNGKIATIGDFGLAQLSADGSSVLWSKDISTAGGATASVGRRLAVAQDGTVAVVANKIVTLFNESGTQVGQFTPAGTYVEDITIDSASSSVIVTGYTQKDGGSCSQLQVAYVRAYSYTGTQKWKSYDWTHAEAAAANSSCADTRGMRIALGRDNKVYFAGESAGGNSIYRYNTKNVSSNAPNIKFDKFNDPFQTSSNHITYYTRLNPASGDQEKGQFNLARLPNNNGNTIRPRAITADESGTVYIGGVSAAFFADRSLQQINGTNIGTYVGGDNFMLVVPSDFLSRANMTTWTNGCGAETRSLSAAFGVQVMTAQTTSTTCSMMTVNPVQATLGGLKDGFYSVWGNVGTPTVDPTPVPQLNAQIQTIQTSGTNYTVNFTTTGFQNSTTSTHTHFYYNNEANTVANKMFYSPSPFILAQSTKPSAATQLCTIVGNADHSVVTGSGNCVNLPPASSSSVSNSSSSSQSSSVGSSSSSSSSTSSSSASSGSSSQSSSVSASVSSASSQSNSTSSTSSNSIAAKPKILQTQPGNPTRLVALLQSLKPTIGLGDELTITLKNLRYSDGSLGQNLTCKFNFTFPSGKRVVASSKSDSFGECQITLTKTAKLSQIDRLWLASVQAADLISGDVTGFNTQLGQGSVYVEVVDSNVTYSTSSLNWQVTGLPTSGDSQGLPRTGGEQLYYLLLGGVMTTVAIMYLVYRSKSQVKLLDK